MHFLKTFLSLFITINLISFSLQAAFTATNPVEERYPGEYPWTNNINWNNVKLIYKYSGTDLEKYNSARDEAALEGGGVIYFPAGTYYFDNDLYLVNGVVIMGEKPAIIDAKDSLFAPPTRFEFPAYVPSFDGDGTSNATAFKKIRTLNPDTDSNFGICWIDINRAGISWSGNRDTGKNQNIFLFGIRTNNVADPQSDIPDKSFQHGWQRWSNRHTANVSIMAYTNVLVANTRHNDAITDDFGQEGYLIQRKGVLTALKADEAPFSYTNHYGIRVNRSGGGGMHTPETAPYLFREGIVIRDNWVLTTMRVKIEAAGRGLHIKDNILRDCDGKVAWIHPAGKKEAEGSNTFENRIIDWAGWNVVIEGNDGKCYRHQIENTHYQSTDGEGIMIQEVNASTVNGAIIRNNIINSTYNFYKMRHIQNVQIMNNTWYQEQSGGYKIIVWATHNDQKAYTANEIRIEGNTNCNGDIELLGIGGGKNNFILNNSSDGKPARKIKYTPALEITIKGNTGFTYEPPLPTSNPINNLYPGEYLWTDSLKWENIKNIQDYPGQSWMQKYIQARDEAAADGGGVIFFPGDTTYYFEDDLYLTDGVIIMGETPANFREPLKNGAIQLKTRFIFPEYIPVFSGNGTPNASAFKKIKTLQPASDSNFGICWIDVNRAGIFIRSTPGTERNRNIVILGCRMNNMAEPDPDIPQSIQNPWQRYSYRHAANICVQAFENVLIANNLINDKVTDNYTQPGYKIQKGNEIIELEAEKAIFSYTDHSGIVLNRSTVGSGFHTPLTAPQLFRKGLVIRDNWILTTMGRKIYAAGDGLIIKDNILHDTPEKKVWIDSTGYQTIGQTASFQSSLIDWTGWNILIEGNDGRCYSHQLENRTDYSHDGDGIVANETNSCTINNVTIRNNKINSNIFMNKMKAMKDVFIQNNSWYPEREGGNKIWLLATDHEGAGYSADNIRIENNLDCNGDIEIQASGNGSKIIIGGNKSDGQNRYIRYSAEIQNIFFGRQPNVGFQIEKLAGIQSASGEKLPQKYNLGQNYPNPFNSSTCIIYQILEQGHVELSLYNIQGQKVLILVNEKQPAGVYKIKFALTNLASGVYFYQIKSDKFTGTRKMILMQ